MSADPILVNYGGGSNSTALLVGLMERGERPDAILFADTGGERHDTYTYLDVMDGWLLSRGFPQIERVRRQHNDEETLEANCLRYGKLPSLAYGYRTCSTEWKRRPIERWEREWPLAADAWASGGHVVKVIGYDADEPQRAQATIAAMASLSPGVRARETVRFPLIEWEWGRDECIAAIARSGLPQPGKSSCFFCPSNRPPAILRLARRHPDLYARALAIEDAAKAEDARTGIRSDIVGLARNVSWRSLVEADAIQTRLWPADIPCDCYDGAPDAGGEGT